MKKWWRHTETFPHFKFISQSNKILQILKERKTFCRYKMAHPIRLLRALVAGGVFVLIIFIAKTTCKFTSQLLNFDSIHPSHFTFDL